MSAPATDLTRLEEAFESFGNASGVPSIAEQLYLAQLSPSDATKWKKAARAAETDEKHLMAGLEVTLFVTSGTLVRTTDADATPAKDDSKAVGLYLLEARDPANNNVLSKCYKRYGDFVALRQLVRLHVTPSLYSAVFDKLPSKKPSLLYDHTSQSFLDKRAKALNEWLQLVNACKSFRPKVREILNDFRLERTGLDAPTTLRHWRLEKAVIDAMRHADKTKKPFVPPPGASPTSPKSAQRSGGGFAAPPRPLSPAEALLGTPNDDAPAAEASESASSSTAPVETAAPAPVVAASQPATASDETAAPSVAAAAAPAPAAAPAVEPIPIEEPEDAPAAASTVTFAPIDSSAQRRASVKMDLGGAEAQRPRRTSQLAVGSLMHRAGSLGVVPASVFTNEAFGEFHSDDEADFTVGEEEEEDEEPRIVGESMRPPNFLGE